MKSKEINNMKSKEHTKSQKLKFGTCFFCDKIVILDDIHCSSEDYGKLQELLGSIPERLGCKIGNKTICKSCKNDLRSISQEDE